MLKNESGFVMCEGNSLADPSRIFFSSLRVPAACMLAVSAFAGSCGELRRESGFEPANTEDLDP